MQNKWTISGFSDEIDADFEKQLRVVTSLGMDHICMRSAYGKGIAELDIQEVKHKLLPPLNEYGVKVSCLGSLIGKISIHDNAAFLRQCEELKRICEIACMTKCTKIRVFSFYETDADKTDEHYPQVLEKTGRYVDVASKNGICLLHENEKEIYGDVSERCSKLLRDIHSPFFKIAFDFANFVQCGEKPLDCWLRLYRYVEDIHIKDARSDTKANVVCGTGDGQISKILALAKGLERLRLLTLEPHLALFDSLSMLEKKSASQVIPCNQAKDGEEGYRLQYKALTEILSADSV